jgi:hypothetical protein
MRPRFRLNYEAMIRIRSEIGFTTHLNFSLKRISKTRDTRDTQFRHRNSDVRAFFTYSRAIRPLRPRLVAWSRLSSLAH